MNATIEAVCNICGIDPKEFDELRQGIMWSQLCKRNGVQVNDHNAILDFALKNKQAFIDVANKPYFCKKS